MRTKMSSSESLELALEMKERLTFLQFVQAYLIISMDVWGA